MPKFYTVGTGITTADEFEERCTKIWRQIKQPYLGIIDVRRKSSKSRNGRWCYQGNLCAINEPALANDNGGTQAGLRRYHERIKFASSLRHIDDGVPGAYQRVLEYIRQVDYAVILLCSCGKAFKPNGKSWNCHRVPLSLELLGDLEGDWEIEHL